MPLAQGIGCGFRVPRIALDAKADHYAEILSKDKNDAASRRSTCGIYDCRAQSLCDTSEALQTALRMFYSSAYDLKSSAKNRIPCRKAIILFVNGEPTGGINSSEAQKTLSIAGEKGICTPGETCDSSGVAVFTIGLNLCHGQAHSSLMERQQIFLSDRPPGFGQPAGLSWRSGHGGRYYRCENLSDVKEAFSDLARQFSQCQ